jgi:hypothetical protein
MLLRPTQSFEHAQFNNNVLSIDLKNEKERKKEEETSHLCIINCLSGPFVYAAAAAF